MTVDAIDVPSEVLSLYGIDFLSQITLGDCHYISDYQCPRSNDLISLSFGFRFFNRMLCNTIVDAGYIH